MKSRSLRLSAVLCRRSLVTSTSAFAVLALGGVAAANAADIFKENNADNLDQGSSWVGGVVPGAGDIIQWNATVAGANSVSLGSNLGVSGVRITNPGGAVNVSAASTLTLGSGGIDMSTATQGLTIGTLASLAYTAQTWNAGSQSLNITSFTRGAGSVVNIVTSGGGSVNIASGAASAQLSVYAVLNGSDYVGLDASKNVVAATYASYSAGGNLSNTYSGILNITGATAGSTQAWRNSNALTVASGVRFGVNNTQNTKWTVDTSSSGRLLTTPSILVGSGVTQDVEFNGSGGVRPASSGGDLLLQNYGAGNLIFNTSLNNGNPAATNIVVAGGGKVIIASTSNYTGTTKILSGGVLQVGNGGTAGTISAGAVQNDGTLIVNRSDAYSIAAAISGSGTLTKQGAGTLTLSGSNSYTGTTTISVGTIALGANNVFADTAPIKLNGGTLDAATFTDTLGALDLDSASTITLGLGSALAFAASNGMDWGSSLLNITGTFVEGNSIRFGTNATALTPGQLGLITVNGNGGYGLDANGFLVFSSVPEPRDWGLMFGGFCALLVLARLRNRRQTA